MATAKIETGTAVLRPATLWRCGGRQCGAGECEHEENELHRHAEAAGPRVAPPVVHEVLSDSGSAFGGPVRHEMEQRLGHDFGAVRIHNDQRSSESARAVAARAYTVGQHIVFGSGTFDPGSSEGKKLLAHELVHTMQQTNSSAGLARSELEVSRSSDPQELEADRIAEHVVRDPT